MSDHPSNRPFDHLEEIFTYHRPTNDQRDRYVSVRVAGEHMASVISMNCPQCEDTNVALRKVREAVMTANAAIALEPTNKES